MSLNVDFYVLKEMSANDSAHLACRLAEKAYLNGKITYIHCDNPNTVAALDQLLWTFKEDSFIPHASTAAPAAQSAPIVIGCNNDALTRHYDILINLHPDINPNWEKFSRILDIIANDALSKELGRQRYKYYRDANCPLSLHEL